MLGCCNDGRRRLLDHGYVRGSHDRQASDAREDALSLICSTGPTTPAGFLAAFERFMEREHHNIPDPIDGFAIDLLASARALFGSQDA